MAMRDGLAPDGLPWDAPTDENGKRYSRWSDVRNPLPGEKPHVCHPQENAQMTSPRPPGQTFESCPAATGQPPDGWGRCPDFPDGAHRCGEPRDGHERHRCTDGFMWNVAPLFMPSPPIQPNRFRRETK